MNGLHSKRGNSRAHTIREEFLGISVFIGVIWIVFLLDRILPLEVFALYPRHISGLPGILLSPLLHKDIGHIIANSTPLAVLLALLAGSRADSRKVILAIIICSGTFLWLFGRSVPVVGASGLVFGLIGYLITSGLLERRLTAMAISLFVGLTYGTTLLAGILPGQSGISWDGHLFGVLSGILCAWILAR